MRFLDAPVGKVTIQSQTEANATDVSNPCRTTPHDPDGDFFASLGPWFDFCFVALRAPDEAAGIAPSGPTLVIESRVGTRRITEFCPVDLTVRLRM